MRDAPFTLDATAVRYLTQSLEGFAPENLGLAVCLATQEHHSIYNAHSIDLCGIADVSDCELYAILGRRLWIRAAEVELLAGRELTVIEAGSPKKRLRLVIKGITEREVRMKLCGGA
jgi:hypothetical protein